MLVTLREACLAVPGVPVPEPASAVSAADTTRWVRAGRLAEADMLAPMVRLLTEASSSRRIAGVVAFAQGLVYATAVPSAVASFEAGIAVDIDPDGVWFGFGAGGFCERLALEPLRVIPVVTGEFEERTAGQVAAVLNPVFEDLHRLTRVGRRVIWSTLADSVHAATLTAALARPLPMSGTQAELRRAWSGAAVLVDALAERMPSMSSRPREFVVGTRGIDATWLVRGGCCFIYRRAAEGAHYCATCPILDDEERRAVLARWIGDVLASRPHP